MRPGTDSSCFWNASRAARLTVKIAEKTIAIGLDLAAKVWVKHAAGQPWPKSTVYRA